MRTRLRLVAALFAAAAMVLSLRLVHVMVLQHARYDELARRQQRRTIDVPSPRGEIRTADGYILASSEDRLAAQVDTQALPYPELFAAAAADLLGCDAAQLAERLTSGPRAVWLGQRLDADTAEAVRSLAPGAVVLVPDAARIYPLGHLASPVVGFVGREELATVGRWGLENHYDDLLAGEPLRFLAVHDAVQRQLRLERLAGGRPGLNLELTLLAQLQAAVERQLERTIAETGAEAASAVVLDPATGDLLALASVPGFDPSEPAAAAPECWRLRAVQDAYEPGSTVKPLVAAAALAARVTRPGELFTCANHGVTVAGHWVRDHVEPGTYPLEEVVARSSNAGTVELALRLQPDQLYRALQGFGFGRETGVGFPAEAAGLLAPPRTWSGLSRPMLALGQELTATPLQLAAAYAAVANGGWLPTPRLVARASGPGEALDGDPVPRARVMSEPLARRIAAMLELVVNEGTGARAAVTGYRTAGKTGTAQRAVAGGFDDEHHVSWFAGFLPLPEPRAVVVVAVVQPESDFWAASVAAPAFAAIAEATVAVLGLAPAPSPDPDPEVRS